MICSCGRMDTAGMDLCEACEYDYYERQREEDERYDELYDEWLHEQWLWEMADEYEYVYEYTNLEQE